MGNGLLLASPGSSFNRSRLLPLSLWFDGDIGCLDPSMQRGENFSVSRFSMSSSDQICTNKLTAQL